MVVQMINYESVGVLSKSEGGSVVLKVRDKDRGKFYALKLIGPLDDNLKQLIFKREVNALKALNRYEDIVKIYDAETHMRYGDKTNLGGILLEFIEGKSLEEENLTEYSELKKLDLCLRILKAVANAHNNSIIHRDIKPDNIMCLNGKVKIIDFGCSKIKTLIEKETTTRMFSPIYSAPEVVSGGETTEASDIYSLGVVFYKILMGIDPESNLKMVERLQNAPMSCDLKNLLLDMLLVDPEKRLNDINKAIHVFEEKIGQLNVNAHKFCFSIDSSKLQELKKQYVVEKTMTMAQFIQGFLQKDFQTLNGMYDTHNDLYKFVGDQLYMECYYDNSRNVFTVAKIYEIPVDRKVRLQKVFCEVLGKIEFIDSRSLSVPRNHNRQLRVILSNYLSDMQSLKYKSELFDKLFGKWKKSLLDSIEATKSKNGRIIYSDFELSNGILSLSLKEYKNNSIDNIDTTMRYIFENEEQNYIKTYLVGTFEDVLFLDNKIQLNIKLDPKVKLTRIRRYLEERRELQEDYNYKVMSFRRQIAAISALYNDECSARNLKDIILEIETPTTTPHIKTMTYYSKDLNNSQKNAVNKSLDADSISLVQGPPGTGKTKVINEILNQIVLRKNRISDIPRILVVSQSHTAVDNILEGLCFKEEDRVRIVRIGDKKDISKSIADKYTIDAVRHKLFSSVKEKSTNFISQKLVANNINETDILEDNSFEKIKWLKIKEIQEEWVKRCGDFESFDYQLIASTEIIAGTCVGFLSNEHVRDMYFDYVIVDEAAKATTPELLISIIKAKKIILVGDQNQLPPFADSSLSELSIELTRNPEYRLFDILFDILPETHKQILTTQYRMIRNIGDLISKVFYDGIINTDIDDDKRRHNIPFYGDFSIVWYNTSNLKDRQQSVPKGGSYINNKENRLIKTILTKMNSLPNAKSLDIGIITGYSAQKDLIRKSVYNSNFVNIGNIDINTLDAFQGRENDIIIYSTVRTDRSIGFQKEKERINVAFSRAKRLLIICGDLDFFYNWDDGENKYVDIINYIKANPKTCKIINLEEGDMNE
jgi:superfamily I DNA and/or RNA helicase